MIFANSVILDAQQGLQTSFQVVQYLKLLELKRFHFSSGPVLHFCLFKFCVCKRSWLPVLLVLEALKSYLHSVSQHFVRLSYVEVTTCHFFINSVSDTGKSELLSQLYLQSLKAPMEIFHRCTLVLKSDISELGGLFQWKDRGHPVCL